MFKPKSKQIKSHFNVRFFNQAQFKLFTESIESTQEIKMKQISHFFILYLPAINILLIFQLILFAILYTFNSNNLMHDYPSRSRQNFAPYEDPLTNNRRSYNFQNMQKSVQLSQTDKRIEEIKRKYDTPNRRDRITQLSVKKSDFSNNKENQNYGTADFKTRLPVVVTQGQGSDAGMKQSKAIANSRQSFFNNPTSGSKSFIANGGYRQKESFDPKIPTNKLYTNQNEQEFFKRVKQMKQSLLYGENPGKSTQMKTSTFYPTQKESRTRSGLYDSNNQAVEKDRIDNIDKINQKIKGILQCLNQNEKTRIPSKYEPPKRGKTDVGQSFQQESRFNIRDNTRTPVKNPVTSSIIGKQSFGNHRHERSELLDKLEINKEFRDDPKKQVKEPNKDDDKWQKLSSKLEKYELENKLRMQKAYDFSKQAENQGTISHNTVDNIIKQKLGKISNLEVKKSIEIGRRDNRSMDMTELRSRSFINSEAPNFRDNRDRSLHTRDFTDKKEYAMKSGKKLDDQIDKIQKKIQQFEQEKKRLGVNFTPFNYSNTKSASNIGLNHFRTDYSERKVSDFSNNLTRAPVQTSITPSRPNYRAQFERIEDDDTFRERKQVSFKQKPQENSFSRLDSKIEIKLENSNPSSVRTSKFISEGSSRVSNSREDQDSYAIQSRKVPQQTSSRPEKQFKYFFDQSLKKKTDQGIEQRKKKLMNSTDVNQVKNTELKSLVQNLCDQVKLDEDFRNSKIWFQYNSDPKKEEELKKLMSGKSLEEIREIMKLRESQNNPFFTTQGFDSSFERLVELYKKSESHWREKIYHKFDWGSLEGQGFSSREIDLQKKGHISLGDLVRFLNLQSGTFYRNRDLSLVFIRICKENGSNNFTEVSFEWLRDAFCL